MEKLFRGAKAGLELAVIEVVVVAVVGVVEEVAGLEVIVPGQLDEAEGKGAEILAAMPGDTEVRTCCNLGPRASEDVESIGVEALLSPFSAADVAFVVFIAGGEKKKKKKGSRAEEIERHQCQALSHLDQPRDKKR